MDCLEALYLLVPPERIEPSTSSLPMMCSTTEPWRQKVLYARQIKLHNIGITASEFFKEKWKKNKTL